MAMSRVREVAKGMDPALGVLAFVGFMAQVGISVMLPLLPLFASQLGATPFQLGLLTSAFAATNAIAQFVTGFLADRWGSRRFVAAGTGLYAAMNALIATAGSATWLLVWRTLAGLGGGTMIVSERIYIAAVARPERRAFANGIISAAQSAGLITGPAFGGLIAGVGGLRAPFVLVALTSAVAFVGTLFLPDPARRERAASAVPETDGGRLAYAPIIVLLVANLGVLAGYGAFITTYGPLASERLGWSTFEVGIAFSFFGGGSILLGPPLAHLADRFGRRMVAAVSTVPVALFSLSLVLALPQPVIFGTAVLAGGGVTGFTAAWYALLADAVDERRRGRVFGVVSAISNAGIVVGAMVAAQLWERGDIGLGMLTSGGAFLFAGVVIAAFRPRRATSVGEPPRP